MTPAAMTTEALTALLGAMTPGPWEPFAWGKHSGATAKDADVAHCHGHHSLRPQSEEHANARAIALTPTLIAELLTARSQIEALKADRYALAVAICGGEDFPGLIDATATATFVDMACNEHVATMQEIDRAIRAEAREAAALARVRVLEDAQTWQPIATAPKDGTEFLGVRKAWPYARNCYWDRKRKSFENPFDAAFADQPTHWMPMPALNQEADG